MSNTMDKQIPAGKVEEMTENELLLAFIKVFNDGIMAGAAKENPEIHETYKLEFIRTRNEILTKFKASGAEHIAGLIGALENILIAYSMGWDLDGVMDVGLAKLDALPPELRVASQSKIDSDQSNCETI